MGDKSLKLKLYRERICVRCKKILQNKGTPKKTFQVCQAVIYAPDCCSNKHTGTLFPSTMGSSCNHPDTSTTVQVYSDSNYEDSMFNKLISQIDECDPENDEFCQKIIT